MAAKNLVRLFEAQAAARDGAVAVKQKRDGRWLEFPWAEVARRARDVADGLGALGLKHGDRVAVLGDTNLEWILADLGILGAAGITVTIYQSNLPHEVEYILRDSGSRLVFCDSQAQVDKIHEVRGRLPGLEGLVRAFGAAGGPFERTLAELEKAGVAFRASHPRAHDERLASVGLEDPASIIYTSGTTGNPKGVVLTHGNWTYEATAVADLQVVKPDDTLLMFLPMAHSFAKVIEAVWFSTGATGAFVESMDKIVENAGEVKPTVMPSVPRIFEKAYNAVITKGLATRGLKGKLFKAALEGFETWVEAKEQGHEKITLGFLVGRKLVFPKLGAVLADRFGGKIRLFVSGGAPLSPKIAWFFSEVGFTILEGYGLTETSAGTFVNRPGRNRIGTVGPPIPGTEVRIAEDGEILVKGPGVMKEYFGNPAATAESLKDGWFATGDIGEVDHDGCLKITDRKKDLIVTAGGKNVAPQNLENDLKTVPLISQVMVHGDKRRFLSALITLNPDAVKAWAADQGIAVDGPLHENRRLRATLQQSIDALNARQPSYSTIKKFAIVPRDFTQETGELTPTLKVKRKVVTRNYQAVLDAFYAE